MTEMKLHAQYATLLKPKKSYGAKLTIGKSYLIKSTWCSFFTIDDDDGKEYQYSMEKKRWMITTKPIIEFTAEDKACEVLHGIDFTTEKDMLQAVVNVANLIRQYETPTAPNKFKTEGDE